MSLNSTEAVILKSFNWSESSRTVVFISKKLGRLALIDKGGRSFKSKRGRLLPFARMEIGYYESRSESGGYIRDVDLVEEFGFTADGSLGRLAYASAACELLFQLLPEEEPQLELYDYLLHYLTLINSIDKNSLPVLFLAFFLRTLSILGYYPSLTYCVGCSKPATEMGDRPLMLVPARGGFTCDTCQTAGDYYIPVALSQLEKMGALQAQSLTEAANLPIGYNNATQLLDLLGKFLAYQTGGKPGLKSLEFLEKLKNSNF